MVDMDVRSIEGVAPVPMHQGTVPVWWLWEPRELKEASLGGYLELICEFEVEAGGELHAHSHPTHEFYYFLSGRGIMTIGEESREVHPGDLVYIPPDAVHTVRPASEHARVRALVVALGLPDTPELDYSVD
jgi:quercetin dioxygenase-like cupin family protein